MILPTLSQRVRSYPLGVRAVSGIMNYAAAAGGSKEPPQQFQQRRDDVATQAAHTAIGHASKPRSPRRRSPDDHGHGNRRNEHVTREEHKPKTEAEEDLVYVLTFKLTDSLAKPMNLMREQYFPPRLNRTPAHLTLFHALPNSQFAAIDRGLSQLSTGTKPFFVSSGKPFRMRLGVGINVGKGYNRMMQIQEDLRSQWMPYLSEQDQGRWRPHWTVMNKVNEEKKVDEAFRAVEKEMLQNNREGQVIGLDLWRYDKGNWIFTTEYNFKG